MPWDRGYYYRSRKVAGRVEREYVGGGLIGRLAAAHDERDRERRRAEAAECKRVAAELRARDAEARAMYDAADLVARAVLVAAGYHRAKRGPWRKRRGKKATGPATKATGPATAGGAAGGRQDAGAVPFQDGRRRDRDGRRPGPRAGR
jgi:hypothetical protein